MQQCLRSWAPLPCARVRAIAPPGHALTNVRARPEYVAAQRTFATAKYNGTQDLFDLIASNEPATNKPPEPSDDPADLAREHSAVDRADAKLHSDETEQPLYRRIKIDRIRSRRSRPAALDERFGGSHHDLRDRTHASSRTTERRPKTYSRIHRMLQWKGSDDNQMTSDLNATWDRAFNSLWERSAERRQGDNEQLDIPIDSRAVHWVDIFLSKVPGETMWTHSALWLLANDPPRMLSFLLATHHAPYPPAKFVSLSLQYLAMHYTLQGEDFAAKEFPRILDALSTLAKRDAGDSLRFLGSFARLLSQHLSGEEIQRLYDIISTHSIPVTWKTMLSLSTRLAAHGDLRRAIDAYLQAHRTGVGRPVDESRQTCTFLLRSAMNQSDGLQECLRLCSKLSGMGLQPDTQMANVLVLNATQAGQVKTAMELYSVLFGQGLQPDEYTLGILIKAYRQDASAAIPLDDIVDLARTRGTLVSNHVVATDILVAVVQRVMKQNPERAWSDSWQMYSEMFDTAPLLKLGLPPPADHQAQSRHQTVQQPTLPAIREMLDVYLKLQRHNGQNSSAVLALWKQFQALVSAGDPLFLRLAKTDHCYNLFLYAFGQKQQTLLTATEVIKDMQTPLPAELGVKKCQPTDRSWNIFLLGFRIHRLEKLAEQILQHMQSEGIKPSQVAWEQLADSYAEAQDLDGLLSALSRADQSGAVWTGWMDQAVGRFKNKHQLQQALLEERMNEPTDFTSDLKASLASKLGGYDDDTSLFQLEDDSPASNDALRANQTSLPGIEDLPSQLTYATTPSRADLPVTPGPLRRTPESLPAGHQQDQASSHHSQQAPSEQK